MGLDVRIQGVAMKAWYEDDDFWRTMAPYLFARELWEDAPAQVDGLLRLAKVPEGAQVLDLCCGPGRHSLELARRGFQVTAVDRTRDYLDAARAQAAEEGLRMEFVQEDMRRFRRSSAFQLALNLYTSFGYFEDPGEDRRVAENLYVSLKPGGKLIVEMMGREVLTRIFRERDWQPTEDGGFFLEERQPSSDWTWMNCRWILIQNGEVKEFSFSHRIYGGADLARILLESGFQKVMLFGDLQGAPYDHKAKRLTALALK
jgi:SAM-dependent methyltransferase